MGTGAAWNWIKSTAHERMTAEQAPKRQRGSANRSVPIYGFGGVIGTGGHIAAGRQKHRRERALISSQQK